MEERTYYMILGVSRTESPSGIRSAYRDLAKKLHPDVAGQQATHAFQEITEAYDVLSDPRRRRAYNDELRRVEREAVMSAPPAQPVRAPASIFGDAVEGLNVEVLLTPEEGRHGCVLPLGVPVFRRCHQCGGSGRDWLLPCLTCRQRGTIEREEIVRVRIPPMPPSGSVFEIPLRGSGIPNFHLRLHVFVEPEVANERRS